MTNFKAFGLPDFIIQALEKIQITQPTPIQSEAIPIALANHDILACAQTGTGKTIAYLIPLITQLLNCSHGNALILAPTRELADQIKNSLLTLLGKKEHYQVALLIGGVPIYRQFLSLKKNPKFIIGTPGRVIDHLERGSLRLGETRYFVLDETDRMLEMGFCEDIEKITQSLPCARQTLMFSATMPDNIVRLSKKYLKTPQHITIGRSTSTVAKIDQKVLKTPGNNKFSHLLTELNEREGSVIIFVKTKFSAALIADKLRGKNHLVEAIHGDLKQRQRNQVILAFRNQKVRVLVATDIAARGLDVPHVMHVINYDLPQCPEDYIHRIGRTGRAGMSGNALSFVTPEENRKWRTIYDHVNHGKTSNFEPKKSKGSPHPRSKNNLDRSQRPRQHAKRNHFKKNTSKRSDENNLIAQK